MSRMRGRLLIGSIISALLSLLVGVKADPGAVLTRTPCFISQPLQCHRHSALHTYFFHSASSRRTPPNRSNPAPHLARQSRDPVMEARVVGYGAATGGVGRQYDPEHFVSFFAARPWLVAHRIARISGEALSILTLLIADLLSGHGSLEEVLVGRADQVSDALARLGPTYNKFGQALSTRPDLVGKEVAISLAVLQDNIPPFPLDQARALIRAEEGLDAAIVEEALENLSAEPVAAGSIGQVYSSTLAGEKVAVKVLRPHLHRDLAADSIVLRAGAHVLESLRNPVTGQRLIRPRLVDAVDEFFGRLFEESDFRNEAANIERFAALYTGDGEAAGSIPDPGVVVPSLRRDLCGDNVITMEWIDGDKLMPDAVVAQDDLPLLRLGISCTLSQLLETGVMHADPHPGNLLKTVSSPAQLVYLDFGLVSDVPIGVREGLVRAVAYLVARDYDALANLFSDLLLIPKEVLEDKETKEAFTAALAVAADELLPSADDPTDIPELKFDRLIDSLAGLAPRFEFSLPPYFLNNARAIGTLEGMARSADPSFNVLAVVYGFAVQTLLTSDSMALVGTLKDITYNKDKQRLDIDKVRALVKQAASIAGVKRRQIVWDVVRKRQGRRIIRGMVKDAVASKTARMTRTLYRQGEGPGPVQPE